MNIQLSEQEPLLPFWIDVIQATIKEEDAVLAYDGSDEAIANLDSAEHELSDALANRAVAIRAVALDRLCRSDE